MAEQVAALHCETLDSYGNGLATRITRKLLVCESTIFFEDKLEGFLEVSARFWKGLALCIHSGYLLYPGDIPAAFLFNNSGEFTCHQK